ncbi:potassium transporter TrkA [Stenotrophomonas panacihumi]|uniref:Potassium transporter TrkA n=1 Tax=Stenotrophomonas panacihumi TaxID=676599 RepID=A0A0R0ANI5_9GAMM|nr:SLC13 family permease [Stenotrophomonas panacihumi]KRG46796.1 potassium transporter TrkA [Stenotrophomonas panacihumi]PTN53807.1 SLC13 family permease [Stenotrophomonas panacihumi]
MESQQIVFLVILAVTLVLFISGRLRVDLVALLATLALTLAGILKPAQALSGFASEPAIIVAAVFVLSAGLSATGITDRIGAAIGRAAGGREWRAIAVTMPATAAMAAFSHHLMITAMMLPVMMRLAREQQLAASRLLMPMSLAASLGTTLTLISAPAFLLANDLLSRAGQPRLDLFAITPIGIVLVLVGMLYMLAGRWLLPKRQGEEDSGDYLRLERYYTELLVEEDSPWAGRTLGEFEEAFSERLQVADWLRHGLRRRRNDTGGFLRAGDVLLVRASPDEIASVRDEPGLTLHAVAKYGEKPADGHAPESFGEEQLVQAVVAPHSEFVGRSVSGIDFLHNLGVVVVGLWRKQGWLHGELSEVRLEEGDLLVLWGSQHKFQQLSDHRGFLMLMPFDAQRSRRRRWPVALGIMLASVVAAATEWLPPQIAFLAGAVAMVLSRCVTLERAYEEIDVRIYVMIAGVIPLGIAMDQTGTAQRLADLLLAHVDGLSPLTLLLVMFSAAALLTQILSDAATTVLLTPIALAVAEGLHLPPVPFVICTAMGAVASFLTPIGHHGNLLILNPGQYRFADFLKVGVPLTALIGLAAAWTARWLWLGGPLWPFVH